MNGSETTSVQIKPARPLSAAAEPSLGANSVENRSESGGKLALIFAGYCCISVLLFAKRLLEGRLIAHGDGLAYYYPLAEYWSQVWRAGARDWNTYNFLGYSLTG